MRRVFLLLLILVIVCAFAVVAANAGTRIGEKAERPPGPTPITGGSTRGKNISPFPLVRAPTAAGKNITWPPQLIPRAAAEAALRAARSVPGFGPLTPAEYGRLGVVADKLQAQYGTTMDARSLASLRTMELAQAARAGPSTALRNSGRIAAEHAKGVSITRIALHLRIPPLAVARQLLFDRGLGVAAVKRLITAPGNHPLAAELREASAADLGSRGNSETIRVRAQEYEDSLGRHLSGLGVRYMSEAEARERGEVLTPDYLLREPVEINGTPIHWIDAKDYVYVGQKMAAASLRRQAAKYTEAFGPGAFVFSGGHTDLLIEGAILLDGGYAR